MASYNELKALIDAYIYPNGVQAITGQILNGVLKAIVDQVGAGYNLMGVAHPSDDPGTPDAPSTWFAYEAGTYADFGGVTVTAGELAIISSDGLSWTKQTIFPGIQSVAASVDDQTGTPSVTPSYDPTTGALSFAFHNMKGAPGDDGDAAGFGTIGATVDDTEGTPAVSVQESGPNTAKNLSFQFTGLKGKTGVTSVLVTVDDTVGTPSCAVSLSGQVLSLAFTGLKGAQGDTGSSVDYPFTIVNNLTTNDATQALSAAQGKVLKDELTQLEAKVTDNTNDIDSLQNQLDNYQPIVIEGNVTNAPDEEDITTDENDLLKFADRAAHTNYLGYVILRKGKTFASQVTVPNTIYEIRYNFAITDDFTMPSGCVLRFVGGSISGAYTFTGTDTKIEAGKSKIFGTDITIAGTWNVAESFPVWFGAVGDGITDDTAAIKNCFLLKCPVSLNGSYAINNTVRAYNSVNGNGSTIIYGADYFLSFQDIADFYVKDINIDGQNLSSRGLDFRNVQNVTIQNCTVENIGNATIAQVFAINFAMGSGCKNINMSACRIKNVVYDNLGACGGIGFSNNVNEPEATANNGLYVSDCRFEGFNTSTEDSDCIKVLSDNGLDTNVVITGCFFTGIGKRAIKTQARGVKLIGNTYEVITPVHAVVGFQRGYCESMNDTLIVNPSNGETSEYLVANVFEVAVGGIGIYNFNTVVKNSVSVDGAHMKFVYVTALSSSTFKGLTVSNCTIGHLGFVLGFENTTLNVSDINIQNVKFNNPAGFVSRLSTGTPTSLSNSRFENIGILTSYGPLVNLNFTNISNCTFVLDTNINTIGGTNITTDNGNDVVINFVDKSVSNVSRIEYSGGMIRRAYLYVDTNPSGLSSSKWGVLRNAVATVGTIIYKKTPAISADATKEEMGYILTSVSGSSVGTAVTYSVPIAGNYPQYYLCTDQTEYNNIQTKDSGTLYLIPE